MEAYSDPKITTVKQKDSKRVEMGKKLAAKSNAARERKKQLTGSILVSSSDNWMSYNIDYGYLIGLAGLAIAVGSLYYSRLEYTRDVQRMQEDSPKEARKPDNRKTGDFIEL